MGRFRDFVSKASMSEAEGLEEESYDFADEYEEVDYDEPGELHSLPPVEDLARIVTATPESFADVKPFSDQYRQGVPVIVNLARACDEERRRLNDYIVGLCYGLHGRIERVSSDVMLLSPRTVRLERVANESDI